LSVRTSSRECDPFVSTASAGAAYDAAMPNSLARLLRAGVITGIVDGLWACVLAFAYGSTVTRIWQGVASTVLGKNAFEGGGRTVAIGLLMHFGVAFFWSAVFLLLTLRRRIESWPVVFAIAAIYGPVIWMVMSLIVIPTLVHRPPNITVRWWIQLIGHIFFVGLPIVASIRPWRRAEAL
jgi:hypothetical protein